MDLKSKHILHSGLFHPTLRFWQSSNAEITTKHIMLPIFILDEPNEVTDIHSMPGIKRYGINKLNDFLTPLIGKGLKSVLLFGVADNITKDENGSGADQSNNPIVKALPLLRLWFPDLIIACDVCLCSYTNHGHCGILNKDGTIDDKASIRRIANIAVAYAKAGKQSTYDVSHGAHVVAPSDMMDGRIGAIKADLAAAGLSNKVAVLSYAVKFASNFYGPFRDASKSAPKFGDRQCYQLPTTSSGLAARAAARDIDEGADMLMVKPGIAYLDIVRQTKTAHPEYPIFIYQVSGEYAMLYHSAKSGAINLESVLKEVLLCMRRAGADCIITYFAPVILDMLYPKSKY